VPQHPARRAPGEQRWPRPRADIALADDEQLRADEAAERRPAQQGDPMCQPPTTSTSIVPTAVNRSAISTLESPRRRFFPRPRLNASAVAGPRASTTRSSAPTPTSTTTMALLTSAIACAGGAGLGVVAAVARRRRDAALRNGLAQTPHARLRDREVR
jgi:hypothetical protein